MGNSRRFIGESVCAVTVLNPKRRGSRPHRQRTTSGTVAATEMKRFAVALNWVAERLPSFQPSLKELYPPKSHGESMSQDDASGPIAQAGAVDDRIQILGDELTARDHVFAEVNRFGSREGAGAGYVNENTLDIGRKSAKDWQR